MLKNQMLEILNNGGIFVDHVENDFMFSYEGELVVFNLVNNSKDIFNRSETNLPETVKSVIREFCPEDEYGIPTAWTLINSEYDIVNSNYVILKGIAGISIFKNDFESLKGFSRRYIESYPSGILADHIEFLHEEYNRNNRENFDDYRNLYISFYKNLDLNPSTLHQASRNL